MADLKLTLHASDLCQELCPTCKGEGKLRHRDWQRPNGAWVKGGGYMPCTTCKGKRVVTFIELAKPKPTGDST